jgi:hypothetical protein
METTDKGTAGQADCCSTSACCCSPAPVRRGKRVRTVVFVLIVLAAVALAAAALASRYGWLGGKTAAPASMSQPATGSPTNQAGPSEGGGVAPPEGSAKTLAPAAGESGASKALGVNSEPEASKSVDEPCCPGAEHAAPVSEGEEDEPCCGGAASKTPEPAEKAPEPCCGGGAEEPAPCGCAGGH